MDCCMPGFPSQSLFKLISIESVMPSNHLIFCCPLLLLPSVLPSIRVFSNESVLHIRWPKYWSFSLSISPSNEYSGLISFRIDWLDLLAIQETLKSLFQHHSSKATQSMIFCYSSPSRVRYYLNYELLEVDTMLYLFLYSHGCQKNAGHRGALKMSWMIE